MKKNIIFSLIIVGISIAVIFYLKNSYPFEYSTSEVQEAMIRNDWSEVSRLAQNKSEHPSTSSGRTDLFSTDG